MRDGFDCVQRHVGWRLLVDCPGQWDGGPCHSAEQLVDGRAERFALKIEQRHLERGANIGRAQFAIECAVYDREHLRQRHRIEIDQGGREECFGRMAEGKADPGRSD